MKQNIEENVPGLVFINSLRPVTYNYNVMAMKAKLGQHGMDEETRAKSEMRYTGFIAQEVKAAADAIGYDFSGVVMPEDEQKTMWGIRYSEFVMPLVKAVQELSEENEVQSGLIVQNQQLIDQYEASLQTIQQQVERLEAQVGVSATPSASASKE